MQFLAREILKQELRWLLISGNVFLRDNSTYLRGEKCNLKLEPGTLKNWVIKVKI